MCARRSVSFFTVAKCKLKTEQSRQTVDGQSVAKINQLICKVAFSICFITSFLNDCSGEVNPIETVKHLPRCLMKINCTGLLNHVCLNSFLFTIQYNKQPVTHLYNKYRIKPNKYVRDKTRDTC